MVAPHKDGGLHRATLLKLHGTDSALVQYVDWGSLALVKTEQLRTSRELSVAARDRAKFAFRIVLGNVLPSSGPDWSFEALEFIYKHILYTNVKPKTKHNNVKVKLLLPEQTEEPLLASVSLLTPLEHKKTEWVDLADILIRRGWAVSATPAQVTSRDQRERREKFDFGRRVEEETLIQICPAGGGDKHQLPRLNHQLDGGDFVECKLISQLAWNVVTVHLLNKWTKELNLKIFNILEELSPLSSAVRDLR